MRLFVGGLSYSTNTSELRRIFEEVGAVTDASVVEDRFSGQSKGFGFVDMTSDSDGKSAITKLNGRMVGGRPLVVNEARPREERSNSGSGGGYGGGRSGGGGGSRW